MENDLQQAARHLLWINGDRENGYQPGGFTTKLLEAWGHADHWNKITLTQAFPILGEATQRFEHGGREELLSIIRLGH